MKLRLCYTVYDTHFPAPGRIAARVPLHGIQGLPGPTIDHIPGRYSHACRPEQSAGGQAPVAIFMQEDPCT